MHKNACGAILADRPDRVDRVDPRAAAEIEALRADNERKDAEIEALKRANAHDGGPHAPPSHNTLSGKAEKSRKKRAARAKRPAGKAARRPGGQKGHPGSTRKPKPTKFKKHTTKNCRRCKSKNIKKTGESVRTITEVPPPPKSETTKHAIDHYDCGDCGLKDFAPETGLPEEGEHGRNAAVDTVENYVDRVPNRRNAEKMTRRNVPMPAGTAHNTVKRAGMALAGPAQAVLAALLA